MGIALLGATYTTSYTTSSTNYYGCLGNSNGNNFSSILNTTEANAELICRNAGTLRLLNAHVTTNSRTLSQTIAIRHNEATSALSISVSAATTGLFADTSDSVSLSAGDRFCVLVALNSDSGGFNAVSICVALNAAATTSAHYAAFGVMSDSSVSTTNYVPFCGCSNFLNTTESNAQIQAAISGTAHNLYMYVTANSRVNSSTVAFRVGAASKNQSLSISASTTGVIEDTSDSDSLTGGTSLFDGAITTGISAGTLTWSICGVIVDSGTPNASAIYSSNGNASAFTAAMSCQLIGRAGAITGASTTQQSASEFQAVASGIAILITANTDGSAESITFQKNGSNGNQAASVTANSTGWFSDTTNLDSIQATDLWCAAGGAPASGSISLRSMAMLVTLGYTVTTTISGATESSELISECAAIASESLGSVNKKSPAWMEAVKSVATKVPSQAESLELVSRDAVSAIEWMGNQKISGALWTESSGNVQVNRVLAVEILGNAKINTALAAEDLHVLASWSAVPVEFAGSVAVGSSVPIETVASFNVNAAVPLEAAGAVSISASMNAEWLGLVTSDTQINLEFRQNITSVVGNTAIQLESIGSVQIDWPPADEILLSVDSSISVQAETLLSDTSLTSTQPEWASLVSSDTAAGLTIVVQVMSCGTLNEEMTFSVISYNSIADEVTQSVQSGIPVQMENVGDFVSVTSLQSEAIAMVAAASAIADEIMLAVQADVDVPVESVGSAAISILGQSESTADVNRSETAAVEIAGTFAVSLAAPAESVALASINITAPSEETAALSRELASGSEVLLSVSSLARVATESVSLLSSKTQVSPEWLGTTFVRSGTDANLEWLGVERVESSANIPLEITPSVRAGMSVPAESTALRQINIIPSAEWTALAKIWPTSPPMEITQSVAAYGALAVEVLLTARADTRAMIEFLGLFNVTVGPRTEIVAALRRDDISTAEAVLSARAIGVANTEVVLLLRRDEGVPLEYLGVLYAESDGRFDLEVLNDVRGSIAVPLDITFGPFALFPDIAFAADQAVYSVEPSDSSVWQVAAADVTWIQRRGR